MAIRLIEFRGALPPLLVFFPPNPERVYALGSDVANGILSPYATRKPAGHIDGSSICVIDAVSGMQVAEWLSYSTPPDELAHKIAALGRYYGGRTGEAFTVLEVNRSGIATMDELKRLGYGNIYAREVFDSSQGGQTTKLGWETTIKNRDYIVTKVRAWCEKHPEIVRSQRLFEQLQTFRWQKSESGVLKAEHAPGCNDDLVFAFGLAQIGREYAMMSQDTSDLIPVQEVAQERHWQLVQQHLDRHDASAESERRFGDEFAICEVGDVLGFDEPWGGEEWNW